MLSATEASSTPEEWFHRCSGDWDQVRNADKLPGDFSGRCWCGLLGNFDEAYNFLLSLGLLSDPSTSSKDKAKSKVNPYQSAFNKLLQFGSSARATKTAGSYGERPDRTISMGITCNMHPEQYIPMERGEIGSHAASTKERFLVATGRPVQPHEELPPAFCAPEGWGSKTLIEARAFVARYSTQRNFNSATHLIKSLVFSCFSGAYIAPLNAQELRGTTGSPSLLTLLS